VRKRRFKQQLGLTLIEVMIAAGVLALAMVMALGSIVNISSTTAQSEDRAAAAAVVSSVIEQMRATPNFNLRDFDPADVVGGRIVPQAWVVTNNGEIALPADGNAPNAAFNTPVQVRVEVNWMDNAGRLYTIDTTTILGD
jgi:Tfp pilus assembly protein PilV